MSLVDKLTAYARDRAATATPVAPYTDGQLNTHPLVQQALAQFPGPLKHVIRDGTYQVFAYGSLAWDHSEFEVMAKRPGSIDGYARAVSVHDTCYRGRDEDGARGVTLGLDREAGGRIDGQVLTIDASTPEKAAAALNGLAKREIPPNMPIYTFEQLCLNDGSKAIACVADRASRLYVGDRWSDAQKAEAIATAHGTRGTNLDYMVNTAHAFREQGVPDARLERLVDQAVAYRRGMDPAERSRLEALEPPRTRTRIEAIERRLEQAMETPAPAPMSRTRR